jgi:hypothetical protein
MLLIATAVQPFSLIYTAYGDNLPTRWWAWTPALATLLFLALDWTILPLAYFFATTHKVSLKIVLGTMITLVLFGAFEGYFTATERLIQLRLKDITVYRMNVEDIDSEVKGLEARRDEAKRQDASAGAAQANQSNDLMKQIADINAQLTTDAQIHKEELKTIADTCMKIPQICYQPQTNAEQARYAKQIEPMQVRVASLSDQLKTLHDKSGAGVADANAKLAEAYARQVAAHRTFDRAVQDSQVYRWAGALWNVPPREVTTGEANRVLDIFAAAVALSYVVAQALLAISYYGRHKSSFLQVTTPFWNAS